MIWMLFKNRIKGMQLTGGTMLFLVSIIAMVLLLVFFGPMVLKILYGVKDSSCNTGSGFLSSLLDIWGKAPKTVCG